MLKIRDWINKNEIPLVIIFFVVYMFTRVMFRDFDYPETILLLLFSMIYLNQLLLGIEYENKIKQFKPGKVLNRNDKILLGIFICSGLVGVFGIMDFSKLGIGYTPFKVVIGIIALLVFLLIGLTIGITGLMHVSHQQAPVVKKIIFTDKELVVFNHRKNEFDYKNSTWYENGENKVVVSNKENNKNAFEIDLARFKVNTRRELMDELKLRLQNNPNAYILE